jgi:hypothetical protein
MERLVLLLLAHKQVARLTASLVPVLLGWLEWLVALRALWSAGLPRIHPMVWAQLVVPTVMVRLTLVPRPTSMAK